MTSWVAKLFNMHSEQKEAVCYDDTVVGSVVNETIVISNIDLDTDYTFLEELAEEYVSCS